jgi:hypothetical protein
MLIRGVITAMQEQQAFIALRQYLDDHIIGQGHLTQRLLVTLRVGGHLQCYQ